jgi:hypothetical protein
VFAKLLPGARPAAQASMWCKGPCLGETPNQPGSKKNVFDFTPAARPKVILQLKSPEATAGSQALKKRWGWPFPGSQAESSFLLLGSLAPTRPMASKHGALQLGAS